MSASSTSTVIPTTTVDLRPHHDNTGFSTVAGTADAAFNIWSNSFPLEQVPWEEPGRTRVGPVVFRLDADGRGGPDNIRCAGQLLTVPPGRYDWIHLLAASERRTEDTVWLHFQDGRADPETLRVSDFWPQTPPWFGEPDGLSFSVLHYPRHVQERMGPAIWRERVPVTRQAPLSAVRLPDNPAMHVFALELEAAR